MTNYTNEIEEMMAKLLSPQYIQKQASDLSLSAALYDLNKAAEIFDNLGLHIASEAVTEIMEKLSRDPEAPLNEDFEPDTEREPVPMGSYWEKERGKEIEPGTFPRFRENRDEPNLFGLEDDQMRGGHGVPQINNAGWFNGKGERIGYGDLSLTDMIRIAKEIKPGASFIVYYESDWRQQGKDPFKNAKPAVVIYKDTIVNHSFWALREAQKEQENFGHWEPAQKGDEEVYITSPNDFEVAGINVVNLIEENE